jgi:hypothetical protein
MNKTLFPGRTAVRPTDTSGAAKSDPASRHPVPVRWLAAGLTIIVAGGLAIAWSAGAFSAADGPGNAGLSAPQTQPVTLRTLSSQIPVTATLGYAGSYTVTGHSGTLTSLPSPGQVISQGQALYQVDNGSPVVLLYGTVPAWRTLEPGVSGADVAQLNHDLAALGDAAAAGLSAAGWDEFSAATAAGVQKLQAALGISSPPGSLAQGSFAFEPAALRVATVTGTLGGPASGPVLTATSTRQVVTIALDAAQQGEVKAGDAVIVTLPDGSTTPGRVSSVGAVASVASGSNASGSGAGPGSGATIPVTVTLTDPSAAGSLDQAPVTVNITTATVPGALVVPVAALVAQSSGGYAVEVAAGDTRRLVPVTLGIFDDTDGLVQVTGALKPGEQVVVPSL